MAKSGGYHRIELAKITVPDDRQRRKFDEAKLRELGKSIGVVWPSPTDSSGSGTEPDCWGETTTGVWRPEPD